MAILSKAISGANLNIRAANHDLTALKGAPSADFDSRGLFNHFFADEYASAYPSIRAISNEFMKIRPLAVDNNGKPAKHAALNALYHPNKKDSSVMFAEKLAVSVLSLPMTYVLVWRNEAGSAKPGGNFGFKGSNIAGYTFLENPSIAVVDNKLTYSIGAQTFTEDEVMAIPGGVTAEGLYLGYSPSMASKRWATLDSYIADFQKGFFKNNAIPAGMFRIIAATLTDYDDTVNMLQARHRGAGNNGNVTYSHAPIDPNSGKPAEAQIEWIPFAQSNKEIDFKPLLEHVDNRLSEAYGVSAIVKGVDSQATYNNAEVSENGFAKRAVDPLALRIYTQITHELNRITGGIAVAITYKYDIPAISDQEKVRAETVEIKLRTLKTAIEMGFSLDSSVDALLLPNNFKLFKTGNGKAVIDNDKGDVDDGKEVQSAPDPDLIDGVNPVNRGSKGTNPKVNNRLDSLDTQYYEIQFEMVSARFMQAQIDRAIQALDTVDAVSIEETVFIDEAMQVIVATMVANGAIEYAVGFSLLVEAGLSTDGLSQYTLSETAEEAYRAYLQDVAKSYGNDTAESIRHVLDRGNIEGWTRTELENNLRGIMNTDEYRVKRLARSEINRSQGVSAIDSYEQITNETGVQFVKEWYAGGPNPCVICRSLNGTTIPMSDTWVQHDHSIDLDDGSTFVNKFVDMKTPDAHTNCTCTFLPGVAK